MYSTRLVRFVRKALKFSILGKREKGPALLLALVLSMLLLALGMALTYSSLTEFQAGDEYEKHQIALTIADAGLGIVRASLRGIDLADAAS